MLDGVNRIMQITCFYDQLPDTPSNSRVPANFTSFKLFHNGHEQETSLSINFSPGLRFCYLYLTALSSPHIYGNCVLCFSYFKLNTPSERRTQQL